MSQTHSLDLESTSSQYTSITDASQTGLDFTGDFTFEAWIKLESLNNRIIAKDQSNGGNNDPYFFWVSSSGNLGCQYASGAARTIHETNDAPISTGIWYHVAATADVSAKDIKFYINGFSDTNITKALDAATSVTDNTSANVYIGSGNGEKYFDGLIKDVRIFDDVRTAGEIATDAHTESVSDANLQGEWNFNNAYTDASGNGNTLTASASPVFGTDIPWEEAVVISGSTYLETNLVSHYEMEESSGTRIDSKGSNDLTDNATVTSGTGIQGTAADFEATNSEYLSSTAAGLRLDSDMSYSFWVNPESTPTRHLLFNTFTSSGGNKGLILALEGVNRVPRFALYGSGGSPTSKDFSFPTTIALSVWTHLVFVYDKSAGTVECFINGVSDGIEGSFPTGAVDVSMSTSYIGTDGNLGAGNYMDGLVDETGIYSRVLHYGDVLDLYNAGSGIPFAITTFEINTNDTVTITEDVSLNIFIPLAIDSEEFGYKQGVKIIG